MNTLVSYNMASPFGKMETCSKFVIDDISSPFTLHNITVFGQQYTLGLWVKAETEGSLFIQNTDMSVSSEWTKHNIAFTATGINLDFVFTTPGTYYIYHPKLEIGNKPTDWTTAPEDAIDDISDAKQRVVDLNDDVNSKFNELYGYIHIDPSVPSISLGSGESAITLTFENDIIMFKKNGITFGHWDGVDFHTGNIIVDVNERAQFGNFAYIPRSDGSLSFLKVGG